MKNRICYENSNLFHDFHNIILNKLRSISSILPEELKSQIQKMSQNFTLTLKGETNNILMSYIKDIIRESLLDFLEKLDSVQNNELKIMFFKVIIYKDKFKNDNELIELNLEWLSDRLVFNYYISDESVINMNSFNSLYKKITSIVKIYNSKYKDISKKSEIMFLLSFGDCNVIRQLQKEFIRFLKNSERNTFLEVKDKNSFCSFSGCIFNRYNQDLIIGYGDINIERLKEIAKEAKKLNMAIPFNDFVIELE